MWDGVDLYACTDNSSTRFCFVIKKRKGGFKQKHYFKPTGAALWGSTPSLARTRKRIAHKTIRQLPHCSKSRALQTSQSLPCGSHKSLEIL